MVRSAVARMWTVLLAVGTLAVGVYGCEGASRAEAPATSGMGANRGSGTMRAPVDAALAAKGRVIFRFDDFGDSRFWTDTLHLNRVVETLTPVQALGLGLKVDVDALPPGTLESADLNDPATTVALLRLNAVVGVTARVEDGHIQRIGITCALCHSTVDDAVAPGVGHRLDGWPNHDLNVGAIVASSPAIPDGALVRYLRSWGPGFYDARVNVDGRMDGPVVIPPAYGLHGVALETYTGEGPISYWNAYVAVTQMHGQGSFSDPRLGIHVSPGGPNLVQPALAALREYQLSLDAPEGAAASEASRRGRTLFEGKAGCARCHAGPHLTDAPALHDPSEVPTEPTWAERSATGAYRTTPLRGLIQHAPYFHDGSAATLEDVVDRYDAFFDLGLTAQERSDLVAYLRTL